MLGASDVHKFSRDNRGEFIDILNSSKIFIGIAFSSDVPLQSWWGDDGNYHFSEEFGGTVNRLALPDGTLSSGDAKKSNVILYARGGYWLNHKNYEYIVVPNTGSPEYLMKYFVVYHVPVKRGLHLEFEGLPVGRLVNGHASPDMLTMHEQRKFGAVMRTSKDNGNRVEFGQSFENPVSILIHQ